MSTKTDMVPTNFKQLRACLQCSLVKSYEQFYENGCENCNHLNMIHKKDVVEDNTSATFEG
jgi:transcription elongation factor SPT4